MDEIAKAITGAVAAFGGGYAVATADHLGVSTDEWVAIAVATVIGFFAVWAVPNKAPAP